MSHGSERWERSGEGKKRVLAMAARRILRDPKATRKELLKAAEIFRFATDMEPEEADFKSKQTAIPEGLDRLMAHVETKQ